MAERSTHGQRRRVVVVGGGFGGLRAVRALRRADVEITLVDRRNFHLFQPLTYQVATGALAPAEIAVPLRQVFRRQRNAHVILGEVVGFDLEHRHVLLSGLPNRSEQALAYDMLIVAAGSRYSYFGHDEWRAFAPEPKSLEGAIGIRSHILSAFEAAEVERDPRLRRDWLTFAVVGAGPTGVETAGQIAELAHDTLRREFRSVDTRDARILLIEAGTRVLPHFPPSLSRRAEQSLEQLGVTVLTEHVVEEMGAGTVRMRSATGGETVSARTVIWAAGVRASPLAAELAAAAGLEVDSQGRVPVGPDLTLATHSDVVAIGDMASVHDERGVELGLPGLAPVAIQEGRHAARVVEAGLVGRRPPQFRYRDKGNLATIGRARAVADVGSVRIAGFAAWVLWLTVHLFYLIGFQNRLLVVLRWSASFLTHGRGARLIGESAPPADDQVLSPTRAPAVSALDTSA